MLLAHWLVTHLLTRVDFVSRPTTCSASCGRWSPPCSSSGARHLAQREARDDPWPECPRDPVAGFLEWALATGLDAGVWGGTSEDERALRRMSQTSA